MQKVVGLGYKKYLSKYLYFTFLSLISAIGNIGVIYVVNRIISDYFTDTPLLQRVYLIGFFASMILFITCRWLVSLGVIHFTQGLLKSTRTELLQMVLKASFRSISRSRNRIISALTRDTDQIVNASMYLVDVLTSAMVMLLCLLYMAFLSWKMLICLVLIIALGTTAYFFSARLNGILFKLAMERNDTFIKYFNEIIYGFKEILMEPQKGKDIFSTHLEKAIDEAATLNQKAQIRYLTNRIIGQVFFYLFIAVAMIYLGSWLAISKDILVNFIFLTLYIWGPIETVIVLLPYLFQAKISVNRISELKAEIAEGSRPSTGDYQYNDFTTLRLEGIAYKYPDNPAVTASESFSVGPLDLAIGRGEVIFISGGNGSGKTTLINIIAGMLDKDQGDILVNGEKVHPNYYQAYRSLFASVFSDFYLFDQLYGIPEVDTGKAREYLRLFDLENKVRIEGDRFSDINFSTGQRKRLALIAAMLERKPLLILDEFGADQDPEFKRKFYTVILPFLKKEGFSVLAITHDDNYFQYADRLYKMDDGRIKEIELQKKPTEQLAYAPRITSDKAKVLPATEDNNEQKNSYQHREEKRLKQSFSSALIILLLLAGISWFSLHLFNPPESLPASVAPTEFSAERASVYLKKIAGAPHAMGTSAHADVRTYLQHELERLGIETHVQEKTVSFLQDESYIKGYVYNIIGKIKGRRPGKSVLLVSHYDSQPNTFGAADDGAGVAAMLETASALTAGEPLQNDIVLLFTDGEEYESLGARAFLGDSLAKQVAMVINLEARGNTGPSITFEMNDDNGWVAGEFSKAVPYPIASSFYYEAYKLLPNYTDFSVFRDAGYAGINSAFIDGYVNYHRLTDSYANMDRNSLQHHGDNLLALARHFGNISLDKTKKPDKTFFNIAGTWMITYSMGGNILLLLITGGLLFASVATGLKRKKIQAKSIGDGAIFYIVTLITGVALSFGLSKLFIWFIPSYNPENGSFLPWAFFSGFVLITLALYALALKLFSGRIGTLSLLIAIQLFFFLIGAILTFLLPSTAYLFMVPLLFSILATFALLGKSEETDRSRWKQATILIAGLLPAIFILFPLSAYVFIGFDIRLPAISVFIFLMLLGFASPLLETIERNTRRKSVPVGIAFLTLSAVTTFIFAVQANVPGKNSPFISDVTYYLEADSSKANWVANNDKLNEWDRQFFPNPYHNTISEIYPYAKRQFLKNVAQPVNQPPPLAEKIESGEDTAGLWTSYRISSPRQAAQMEILIISSKPGNIIKADVNGENIALNYINTLSGEVLLTQFYGLPVNKQLRLRVTAKKGTFYQLVLCDRSVGLPQELVKQARPDNVIFEQGNTANMTVIKKTYPFGQN